jgi:predicted phosphodiesterase
MRILLLGDCHGQLNLLSRLCLRAQHQLNVEAAIQVGDFGFYPSVWQQFLREGPHRFPIPVHAIDGNHEDHGWLRSCIDNGALRSWADANLVFHERSTVATIGGMRLGFLGGALNADRPQEWAGRRKLLADGSVPFSRPRVPRDPAWANWVSVGDVERAVECFNATPPDLLITHSCPAGIGIGMVGAPSLVEDAQRFITHAGHSGGPVTDCGEGALADLWRRMHRKPNHWIFGHFHRHCSHTIEGTNFFCIGSSDGTDGERVPRSIILDTERRNIVNVWPTPEGTSNAKT